MAGDASAAVDEPADAEKQKQSDDVLLQAFFSDVYDTSRDQEVERYEHLRHDAPVAGTATTPD